MDFRIGADDCYIYYPEIDLGMNLMWQSLPLTMHLVGPSRAKRLVIGGEKVAAETLLAWGLLDEIAPAPQLMDRAFAFAETYVRKSPIAAQMIKRSANQSDGRDGSGADARGCGPASPDPFHARPARGVRSLPDRFGTRV